MSACNMATSALRRVAAAMLASTAAWTSVGAQTPPNAPFLTSSPPIQRFSYDAAGRLTRAAHLAGSTERASLQQSWDGRGRLASQTDGAGGVARWQYDEAGRITSITDPIGLATRYQLGDQGLPVDETSPDAGRTRRVFDAASRVLSSTDARGVTSSFQYDALGRMTAATHQGVGLPPVTASWSYDGGGRSGGFGVGRLTGSAFDVGSATYHHDAWGRLVQQDRTVAGMTQTVRYGFDGAGPLTSMTYPSGLTVNYLRQGPDIAAVWLSDAMGSPPAMLLDQMTWDVSGAPSSWRWGMHGQPTHRVDRDLDGRVTRHPLGSQLRMLHYDATDRLVSMAHVAAAGTTTAAPQSQAFNYDNAGRLIRWQQDSSTVAVTYDANGNRTQQSRNGAAQVLGLEPGSNRLAWAPSPLRRLQYDATGNVIQTSSGMSLLYDAAGRLERTTQAGLPTAYAYDDQGRRVLKSGATLVTTYPPPIPVIQHTPTGPTIVLQQQPPVYARVPTTTLYLYDDDHRLLSERPLDGQGPHREYIWIDDQLVAFVDHAAGSNAGSLATAALYFVHSDHLNTPRVVLDRQGRTRWTWTGDPWGASAPNTNPSGLGTFTFNLRLPGQYFDAETGLAYNWHRYYDAASGRYWQSDPIGLEGGSNSYAYVNGNPLLLIDPNGLIGLADLPSLPDWLVNGAAGFGDSMWFGLPNIIRLGIGIDEVDKCSDAYRSGELADLAFEVSTLGASAALKALAAQASRSAVRRAARPFVNAFRQANDLQGGFVHHVNPLFGHPGKFPTMLPTGGLPGHINSGPWNLRWFPDAASHSAAHRWMRGLENAWAAFVNPATIGIRTARDVSDACECMR